MHHLFSSSFHRTGYAIPAILVLVFFLSSVKPVAAIVPTSVTLITPDNTVTIDQSILKQWFVVEPQMIHGILPTEISDPNACPTEKFLCDVAYSRYERQRLTIENVFTPSREAILSSLQDIATKTDHDPVDAKFAVDNNRITAFSKSITGVKLNIGKSADVIFRALDGKNHGAQNITLPVDLTAPHIGDDDINRLGITDLIATGVTNFAGSPKNRIFNIRRALEQFQGVLIKPGEEFSFVTTLGEVDGDHGYLPELVIKDNKTEPEFGGGICQVSTTVFRAAINAGLKITARRNHAYPVFYYKPYGMDATVYIPKPDLTFVNNTPGDILMQSNIVGTTLTFQFFGTSDGRNVTIDGPHILESNPDGSMKTIFTQTVTDKDSKVIINDPFPSSYKSPSLFPHPGQEVTLTKKPNR